MKVIFTCGGTAGHVNPALALAGYMKKKDPTVDAPQGGVLHHGVAGIAAGAHHQIRRKLPQDLVGSAPQGQEVCGAFQVVPQAVEA